MPSPGRPKSLFNMKRTNIYLSEKQIDKIRSISNATHVPMAEHYRRALDEYIARNHGDSAPSTLLDVQKQAPPSEPGRAREAAQPVPASEHAEQRKEALSLDDTLTELTQEIVNEKDKAPIKPTVELMPVTDTGDKTAVEYARENPGVVVIEEFKP